MPITVEPTEIQGVKVIRGKRFLDERGFFSETYKEVEYLEAGIPKFVQDNLSISSKGVIRGLHWQEEPFAQGKLVTCLSGRILDVAVDIRKTSPTFGRHISIILDSNESMSLWVPTGFAHGFQALEDETRVSYKVTNYWHQASERSLFYGDEELAINWINLKPIVSEKDLLAPHLKNI